MLSLRLGGKGGSGEAGKAAPQSARPEQAAPRNLPPVAAPGVRLFAELFGDPAVHATRWFLVSMALLAVVMGLVLTLVRLAPLKTAVPYLVEVTADGAVARVARAADYKPTTNMLRSEMGRWVEAFMTIDPYLTRKNQREVVTMLRGKAVAEHGALLKSDNPFARLLADPTLVRSAKVSSVDITQEGIAFVYVNTTERTAGSSKPPVRWRFTLHYSVLPPETEEQLLANPAGLVITHILRNEDKS